MDKTEEKLRIALEALKHYERKTVWDMCRTGGFQHRHYGYVTEDMVMPEGWEMAEKALAEIRHIDLDESKTELRPHPRIHRLSDP